MKRHENYHVRLINVFLQIANLIIFSDVNNALQKREGLSN